MQISSSESTNGIPFPELSKAKAVMGKVIPMFNVMHNHHLTVEDGMSLLDLAWRMTSNDMPEPRQKGPAVIVAEPGQTVIQAIRQHYEQRPFILKFEGVDIEITRTMTMTEAMSKGMNAIISGNLPVKAKAQPKKTTRKKAVKEETPAPAVEVKPEPQPAPKTILKIRPTAPVIEPDEDEDEDDIQQPQLATVEQADNERLSVAVHRAWEKRPCRLLAGNHIIHITANMLLTDAQCEAAEIVGVDGNHVEEPEPKPTFEALLNEEPQPQKTISASGLLYDNINTPFQIARFEHPIPVDDSRWNVSHDRNSGADFVRTERAVWLDDYPYRISCVPFEDMMNTQTMFYVHCKERPTQEMFDVYHRLFREHTHKVHVRMTNHTQDGSHIITHEYCSWRPREGVNNGNGSAGSVISTVAEALGLNARWQPNAKYRIKYYDDNLQQVNHRYYLVKPSEQAVRLLDHRKMKAMMQTRPAGI